VEEVDTTGKINTLHPCLILVLTALIYVPAYHNTKTDGTMDHPMSIGAVGYEVLLPGVLPSEAINVALEFIHTLLQDSKQHGSYGTILRYSKKLHEATVPTILFGFPE